MSYRTFLCSHKFQKIVHYFSFEVLKKKILAKFQRIIELFTQKIVTKLSKVWDPGSEIRDHPEKTYSGSRIQGVKKAPDPGSGSATLQVRNHLNEEINPLLPTGIGKRFSQTISNIAHTALLRRVNSPFTRKC
jgi:hypothetical protein